MEKIWLGLLMVASVTLTGSGSIGQVDAGWKVTQQCTPNALGVSAGSTGGLALDAFSTSDSVFVTDNGYTFEDGDSANGSFTGNISSSSVTGGSVSLSGEGPLNFLVADRTVAPVWAQSTTPIFAAPVASTTYDGAGTVNAPYSIAVDPYDNSFFVASTGVSVTSHPYYQVSKYAADGTFISWFGDNTNGTGNPWASGGGADGYFSSPPTLAVNPVDGSVAVGDASFFRIQIFRPNVGRTLYTYDAKIGAIGAGNGQFGSTSPIPLVFDSLGKLYAGDRGNARIQSFTVAAGSITYSSKVAVTGFYSAVPIYELSMSSTDVLYASLITSLDVGAVGTIRTYNTSLVEQATITIPAPSGTTAGIFNIEVDATGVWAHWGYGNYLAHYVITGATAVEDNRWYSGYQIAASLSTNYAIAAKTTGEILVLFKSISFAPEPGLYGLYSVTSFDWPAVPLSNAIEGYMLECDSTLGGLTYAYTAANDPDVVFPAWSGDVWTKLKELCAAFGVEVVVLDGVITVRDIGSDTISIDSHSVISIKPSNVYGGQQVNIVYQNSRAGGGTVYDASTGSATFSIKSNQRASVTVNTTSYPVALDPLVPTSTLPVLPGQYYVIDSTGTNVTPAVWTAAGGNVTASVGSVPGQITFTMQGPNAISGFTSPFTFATALSGGTPALTVTGTGTFTSPETLELLTAADPVKTTQIVAKTIDSFAVMTLEQAYERGGWACDEASGPNVELTFSMASSELNSFGRTPGAIFEYLDGYYRVIDCGIGSLETTITATRITTVDQTDAALAGLTVDERDAIWTGKSLDDRTIKPMALTL